MIGDGGLADLLQLTEGFFLRGLDRKFLGLGLDGVEQRGGFLNKLGVAQGLGLEIGQTDGIARVHDIVGHIEQGAAFLQLGRCQSLGYLLGKDLPLVSEIAGDGSREPGAGGVQLGPDAGEISQIGAGGVVPGAIGGEGGIGGLDAIGECGQRRLGGGELAARIKRGFHLGQALFGEFELLGIAGEAVGADRQLRAVRRLAQRRGHIRLGCHRGRQEMRARGGRAHLPGGDAADNEGDGQQHGETGADASRDGHSLHMR